MRISILWIIILAFITFGFSIPAEEVPNFQVARYEVFASGQPTQEGFRLLAESGMKTVINVLPTAECMMNEENMVKTNDMVYEHFPFETSGFKRETFENFAVLLAKAEKPVLVHCSTGNHVGGLWFGYRVLVDKAPLPLALKEARRIGMKSDLEDAMFHWLTSQQRRAN